VFTQLKIADQLLSSDKNQLEVGDLHKRIYKKAEDYPSMANTMAMVVIFQ